MSGDEGKMERYGLEDIVSSYLKAAFDEIITDMHAFLEQFGIVVEAEVDVDSIIEVNDEMMDDIVEFLSMERVIEEDTDGIE